jgi:hypothetical protein
MEIDIAPDEVDLVVEPLIAEVGRHVNWIINSEGDKEHDFHIPDDESGRSRTSPKLERCRRLLSWARSHGVGDGVSKVYRSIERRFPGYAKEIIPRLTPDPDQSRFADDYEEEDEAKSNSEGSHD